MPPLSNRAKNLRGVLTVLAAMLAPLSEALSRSQVNWPATTVVVLSAGAIAWRAWLDQSLSHDEPDTAPPDVAAHAASPAPSTAATGQMPLERSAPAPSPLSKAVLNRS